jgi:hypothetical protein
MASNPAYALAQYRSAVSRLQEVVALADPADLDRRLHVPGAATDLERRIWHVLRAPGEPGTTRCPR